MGGQGGPIICDFAPIHYLLTDKIPIYCLPLQYQFSDYLPDSDKWTIGQLDKCPITKRTALYKAVIEAISNFPITKDQKTFYREKLSGF